MNAIQDWRNFSQRFGTSHFDAFNVYFANEHKLGLSSEKYKFLYRKKSSRSFTKKTSIIRQIQTVKIAIKTLFFRLIQTFQIGLFCIPFAISEQKDIINEIIFGHQKSLLVTIFSINIQHKRYFHILHFVNISTDNSIADHFSTQLTTR